LLGKDLADDNAPLWIFVGIIIGVPAGLVLGWLVAQLAAPKSSTVLVQKTDEGGYLIVEK